MLTLTSETASEATLSPRENDELRVRVRTARPTDAEAVCTVHGDSVRGLGRSAYDDEQVAAWDHDRDPGDYPLTELGVTFVVAEALGEVPTRASDSGESAEAPPPDGLLGFAEMRPDGGDYFERVPDDYGEVRGVYVHPDAARSGVGTRLLERLERAARRAGRSGLGLHASCNAVGFYERAGYDRLVELDHEFGDTGVTGTVVEMQREL
ncbi:MAG: N-acetyltransferase family protein [Halobaculum sp.]